MNFTKICSKCNEEKMLDEFQKRKSSKDGRTSRCKKCMNKSEREYYNKFGRQNRGYKSMYENKDSANFLGVVIGERLCKYLFKNVEVLPYGNIGFDIICNKGKKIDIKTSCIRLNNKRNTRWQFCIDENTIADYFILIAFDNRTDLNPLHMWMIPGNKVNKQKTISISTSTIHKWNKWKRDINDAQLCCTEMKTSHVLT